MERLVEIAVPAYGSLEGFGPVPVEQPLVAVRGGPASGRSALLRAIGLLGAPPDEPGPDPLLAHPAWSYLAARAADGAVRTDAVAAKVATEAGAERRIVRRFASEPGEGEPLRVVDAGAWRPAPETVAGVGLRPEERRIAWEDAAQGIATDLSRILAEPVSVSIEQDSAGDPRIRLRERGTAYSVGEAQLGTSLATTLAVVRTVRALACEAPAVVLLDDLGAGVHPALGARLAAVVCERLVPLHQLVFVPVGPSFEPPEHEFGIVDLGSGRQAPTARAGAGGPPPAVERAGPVPPADLAPPVPVAAPAELAPVSGAGAAEQSAPAAPETPEAPEAREEEAELPTAATATGPGVPDLEPPDAPEEPLPPAEPEEPQPPDAPPEALEPAPVVEPQAPQADDGEAPEPFAAEPSSPYEATAAAGDDLGEEELRGLIGSLEPASADPSDPDSGSLDARVAAALLPAMVRSGGVSPEDRVDPARYARVYAHVLDLPWSEDELDPSIGIVASIERVYGGYDRVAVAAAVAVDVDREVEAELAGTLVGEDGLRPEDRVHPLAYTAAYTRTVGASLNVADLDGVTDVVAFLVERDGPYDRVAVARTIAAARRIVESEKSS